MPPPKDQLLIQAAPLMNRATPNTVTMTTALTTFPNMPIAVAYSVAVVSKNAYGPAVDSNVDR